MGKNHFPPVNRIRDWKVLTAYLKASDWTIEHRRNGHLALKSPTGQTYFTGSTPSDFRAIRSITSDLRKLGLK